MSLESEAIRYLRESLDDDGATFRDNQWEAIHDLVEDKKRLLVVQRTGWGKSMVMFALCDELSERAKLAGAVNTLIFSSGIIYGDTTDGVGLVNDLLRHEIQLQSSKVLLLGAGGAAKGVVQALLAQAPDLLTIANRTLSKAQAIAKQYPNENIQALTFADTEHLAFDIIINATSVGLSGESLPIADQTLKSAHTCYDMVYQKEPTAFLKQAKALGVKNNIDGLGMLVGQAAASFELWRNTYPDVEPVLAALRAKLNE